MAAPVPVRLSIVEPDHFQRVGLSAYFQGEEDIELLGIFGDVTEAVAQAEQLNPDVVILSLNLSGTTPFEACRQITDAAPDTWVITLGHSTVEEEEVANSMMVGSAGHLPKGADREDFLRVVRAAGAGGILVIAKVAHLALRFLRGFPGPVDLGSLTEVERRTLVLVSDGLNNSQIAQRMEISAHTVGSHVSRVLRKLNVSSRGRVGVYRPMIEILRDHADRSVGPSRWGCGRERWRAKQPPLHRRLRNNPRGDLP